MSMLEPMVDRVLALGAYEGPTDTTAVVTDIFRVAATLLQGSGGDYCACNFFPCECVEVFRDDLARCVAVRHPYLLPEPADPVRCPKCGGPHPFHDPACVVHPDLIQDQSGTGAE